MGLYKDLWDLKYARAGRNTCVQCFGSPSIKTFIRKNAKTKGCSFCDDPGSVKRNACELNVLVDNIRKQIDTEWEDAAQNTPYDSAESEYLSSTIDTTDLLDHEVEVDFQNGAIRDAVHGAIGSYQWVRIFSDAED